MVTSNYGYLTHPSQLFIGHYPSVESALSRQRYWLALDGHEFVLETHRVNVDRYQPRWNPITFRALLTQPTTSSHQMITFFDVTSSLPEKAWNATTWKTRFSLNFKGLPYETHWLEYPEIAFVLESHGIPPYKIKDDGTPYYTVPAILDVDDETGAIKAQLVDSIAIAKYLDKAYPDTPRLLLEDEAGLAEQEKIHATWLFSMIPTLILLGCDTVKILNKESREHFSRARAKDMHPMYTVERLEDVPLTPEHRQELWNQAKACFDAFDASLKEREAKNGGPWYAGESATFADCIFGGYFMWALRVFGQDSREWTNIMKWNDGRWAKFVERIKPFSSED